MEGKSLGWILLTAIAPIAWGSTYFVTRQLLPPDIPLWGSVLRCLPAGLIVLLVARRLPRGSWWWRSLVLGTLTVGGFCVLIYVVGQRLPTSLAATLMSTSAAAMIVFAWVLQGSRPRAAAVAGAAMGIAGVVVMLGPGVEPVDVWGIVASVGAMLCSSLGFVLTARWGAGVPPLAMTSWQLIAGAVVVLPIALVVEGAPPVLDAAELAGFGYLVVVATAIAYAVWFTGLHRLPAGVVGIVGLLNPVTGVVLGVLLAAEPFGPAQAIGSALVLAGVVVGVLPSAGSKRLRVRGWGRSAAPRLKPAADDVGSRRYVREHRLSQ